MCALSVSTNLSETFLILRRSERDIIINVHRSACNLITFLMMATLQRKLVELWLSCVCCYLMCICCTVCIAVFTLEAGLLARSQYSEGPATGHLDTGFSWFPCA